MRKFIVVFTSIVFVFTLTMRSYPANVTTSSDFASNWNGGTSPIVVVGAPIDSVGDYGITISDYLNTRATSLSLSGYGNTPYGTALILGQNTLAFSPNWGDNINVNILNLSIYNATNGAISLQGNGTGSHNLSVSGIYFYNNSSPGNGGVANISAQIQSAANNQYIFTNNNFVSNSAQSGGAIYMASNNSMYSGAQNPTTFSLIDDSGNNTHYIAFNKANAGNGGGVYFLASNDQSNVISSFTSQGYTYYGNFASGLGGAVYNGVLNGNSPDENIFNIISGVFVQNQATSGGSIATSINGGNTNVNISVNGKFYSGLVSGNGGALYNAVGDQYSPYGGQINFTVNGTFGGNSALNGGAIYSNIQPGQSYVVTNISGSFTNNSAIGNGGAIYNTSGNNYPGTSILNIADGTLFWANGANMGGAIYNSGNGIINLQPSTSGITFGNNYAKNFSNGADIYQDSINAVLNIVGSGTVNINDGVGGTGTINQNASTTLNLNNNSQSFGYTGIYNQAAGAKLNVSGIMFGGQNNIGGTANIFSSQNSFYFNANMLSISTLNFVSNSNNRVTIGLAANSSAPGLSFEGSNAVVGFNPSSAAIPAAYMLSADISNGSDNTIAFTNSDVTFGNTNFTGGTHYAFYNSSIIDLLNSLTNYQTYNFRTLNADNTALLTFKIGNNSSVLQSDTINVPDGGGSIGLGKIYVNDQNGLITGLKRIIYGGPLKFQNGLTQYVVTTTGTYSITTTNDIMYSLFPLIL